MRPPGVKPEAWRDMPPMMTKNQREAIGQLLSQLSFSSFFFFFGCIECRLFPYCDLFLMYFLCPSCCVTTLFAVWCTYMNHDKLVSVAVFNHEITIIFSLRFLHIFCWVFFRTLCCTASAPDVNLLLCVPARKCNVPEINGWICKVVCREFYCRVCCIYSRPC